ncbi:MAG: HAMP domain-containing sensor histidine kinase [Alphaproteobacteria bacterium]|nr:HAMP domain-containing sensor histidine kinase [Alphaproteobacteria bacterium]
MRLELLRGMALQQRGALRGMPFTGIGLAAAGLIWADLEVMLAWFLALLASIALIFLTNERFIKAEPKPEEAGWWTLKIAASLIPNFVILPAIVPLLWVDGDIANNVLLTVFMLVSLPMAAVFYGASLPIAFAGIFKFLPLLMIYPAVHFAPLPWITPALFILFTFVNCSIAIGVHRAARTTVLLQLRNEELLRELAAARERAERANETKSVFLASMSHELRTPLNGIMGFSELIQHGAPKYLDYAANIHASGKHLLSLINDILDLAKIEAGKREFTDDELDITEIAQEAFRFLERQAASAKVSLNLDIAGRAILIADRRATLQILSNLLSNAVKFTPPGGQATVFARVTHENFVLGVQDTGQGMTPEELQKAIEPYAQASLDNMTIEGRGTGLGLPIVKALIEAQMGLFRIESTPGAGTKVWAEFAANRIAAPKAETTRASAA